MNSYVASGFALITGAGSGIGKNSAFSFAQAGAAGVMFADINEKSAQDAAVESKKYACNPNYRAVAIHVDVENETSIQAMVEAAIRDFGRIDYNIGTSTMDGIADIPIDEFDHVLNVNMKGTMLCTRTVSKAMLLQEPSEFQGRYSTRSLGRGSIVNLGSLNSSVVVPGKTSYTTAKHAVIGITKTAGRLKSFDSVDNAGQGIRVNAVCPIWVESPMTEHEAQVNPHLEHIVKAAVPLKRMAQPDEVADSIVFLCSPAASFITGVSLVIDAGTALTVRLL
ncbi:oxidoreductase short-chain dehydrogenase reductase family protein [Rutstroemia sp. NJR-2017a BBW]|nr:oxidoreductase short-chain dehydrogenase reductase family protein [Rutstroemia sp. NJR-2017a BBW]